ncbi:MAG: universal stress protein [Arenibacter latericius]|nr:universal stress protein [Arenibacter latericius]
MKNILIPTDLSQNSFNALAYSIKLFADAPINFYVLYVGNLDKPEEVKNSIILPTKEKLKAFMERVAILSTLQGHQFIAIHLIGNKISILREIVAEKKIDLIALGSEIFSTEKSSNIGNNIWEIITKIPCNTLIIPDSALTSCPKQIIFPTNYHIFFSNNILQSISEVLELTRSKLQILNILSNKIKLTHDQEKNREYFEDYLEETHENRYYFHNAQETDVCTAIEEYLTSHNGDMLVLFAKNLNFIHKLLFNSKPKPPHHNLPMLVLHE